MGAHSNPRRKISATADQFRAHDEAATQAGVSWAVWARAVLDRAATRPTKKASSGPARADDGPLDKST